MMPLPRWTISKRDSPAIDTELMFGYTCRMNIDEAKKKLQGIHAPRLLQVREIAKALEIKGMSKVYQAIDTLIEQGVLLAERHGNKTFYSLKGE